MKYEPFSFHPSYCVLPVLQVPLEKQEALYSLSNMKNFFAQYHRRGKWVGRQWLTATQIDVLTALIQGWSLRSHRDLEGSKRYELRSLANETKIVLHKTVTTLRRKRLIETNHKFPSATYLLTGHGNQLAKLLHDDPSQTPLTAQRFAEND